MSSNVDTSSVAHLSEDPVLQQLFALALQVRENSYSPYSKFRVGACVLTDSGALISGCNVENSSYGLTICAERSAICTCVSQGHRGIKAIAITSDVKDSFTYPCGACLQVMLEFGNEIPVYLVRADLKAVDKRLVRELVPFGFGPKDLHQNHTQASHH